MNRMLPLVLSRMMNRKGRSMRFYAVAWLMHRFGPTITPFIDKYFNKLALLFAVLLVGGILAVKYLF